MKHSTTKPTSADEQYTPAEQVEFARIKQLLRDAGLPRRETPDVAAAIRVAGTFRRARALLTAPAPIAHGIAPLPSGGD